MRIEIITRPYEVTDHAGIKNEKLYMSKVKVTEGDATAAEEKSEYETIMAYHLTTKNYFLLNENTDQDDLGGSFTFTEKRDEDIEEEFLNINKKDTVTVGKSSSNWSHIKF